MHNLRVSRKALFDLSRKAPGRPAQAGLPLFRVPTSRAAAPQERLTFFPRPTLDLQKTTGIFKIVVYTLFYVYNGLQRTTVIEPSHPQHLRCSPDNRSLH